MAASLSTVLSALSLLVLAALLVACDRKNAETFPFNSLEVESGSIQTSLDFNPYSDYPPKLRWEIGISFREFQPSTAENPDTTFISYTVDLEVADWRNLPGEYDLSSTNGSDMWIDGMNYGWVDLHRISIAEISSASYEVTLDLTFNFDEMPFKRERRSITFQTEYEGLMFSTPIWNEPSEVEFPESWKIPSTEPHWSEDEVIEFVSRYVDLSNFNDVSIDQSGSNTLLEARP